MNPWRKTKVANLLRHESGRYYARFHVGKKSKFYALHTDKIGVAKVRLAEKRVEIERGRQAGQNVKAGTALMGDLLRAYQAEKAADAGIAPRTRARYREHAAYIVKTWPGFEELRPAQITELALKEWKNRALTEGTRYKPPGAKSSRSSGTSPGTFNRAVDVLRKLLDDAVNASMVARNPVLGLEKFKATYKPAKPSLPKSAKLRALFDEVEANGGGTGLEAADFLRFLAFTGCRLREAAAVRWRDIDFEEGFITVHGTKTEGSNRNVPMIKAARELLMKIRERRERTAKFAIGGQPHVDPNDPVVGVREAQKSLDRACKVVGIERLTHHSLRDAFATTAVEAGVDIPTISVWLGHADGGALLMRTYTAHRPGHSTEQAGKVEF